MVPLLLLLLVSDVGGASPGVFKTLYAYAYPWPDNTVYYSFGSNYTTIEKEKIQYALWVIGNNTCIDFVEGPTTKHHIKVIKGKDKICNSDVGFKNPFHLPNITHQQLSLGADCLLNSMGHPIHEFLHSLGLHHAQQRSDRDDYVIFHWENINKEEKMSYLIESINNTTPYDYNSFMHYTSTNLNNPWMTAKDPDYRRAMGSMQGSFYDYHAVNLFYKCYDKCSPATSANCANGGVPHPRNCEQCLCPRGFAGRLCDERPYTCGQTFDVVANEAQSISLTIGQEENPSPRYLMDECVYWFRAPPGRRIALYFQGTQHLGQHPLNTNVCWEYGWEFKTKKDPRMGGPIFCEDSDKSVTLVSDLNPAPMILWSNGYQQTFSFLIQAFPI